MGSEMCIRDSLIADKSQHVATSAFSKDYNLVNQLGDSFSMNELKDKVWVASFIFTSCQMECPTLIQRKKKLLRHFPQNPNIHLVSVSVDPQTDTPEVLRAYQEKMKIPANSNWTFLSGEKSSINELTASGFKIGTPENPVFHTLSLIHI